MNGAARDGLVPDSASQIAGPSVPPGTTTWLFSIASERDTIRNAAAPSRYRKRRRSRSRATNWRIESSVATSAAERSSASRSVRNRAKRSASPGRSSNCRQVSASSGAGMSIDSRFVSAPTAGVEVERTIDVSNCGEVPNRVSRSCSARASSGSVNARSTSGTPSDASVAAPPWTGRSNQPDRLWPVTATVVSRPASPAAARRHRIAKAYTGVRSVPPVGGVSQGGQGDLGGIHVPNSRPL